MEKKLFYYMVLGGIFTALCGTLMHFAYEYSDQNPLVGMFAPVSESTWEHMKMVFFPAFFYCILGWPFFYKAYPAFFRSCMAGILTGTMAVAVIFYSYTGIWGENCLALDILTFLISVFIVFSLNYQLTMQNSRIIPVPVLVVCVVGIMVGFFAFTYAPPEIALFAEPVETEIQNSEK